MKEKHRLYYSRLFRRVEKYMTREGTSWHDVALLMHDGHTKLTSIKRKLKRLRTLQCKPCACLLLDIADATGMPYEQFFGQEFYED